jgi:hypothetical protein
MWQDVGVKNRLASILPLLLLAACTDQAAPDPAASGTEVSVIESAAPSPAPVAGRVSHYTSLKDCKVVETGAGEDWSVSRCEGRGGIALKVLYDDARDDIQLLRPGQKAMDLALTSLAGGGFNTLDDTVEWRGTGEGGAFKPAALILRNSVVESPERPEQLTALLVVVDLTKGCVVAQVRPKAGQNEAARTIADGPPQPCLGLD